MPDERVIIPEKWTPVCQFCVSEKFHIIGIYESIVHCQCDECFNTFILPGDWIHVKESDCVRVRSKRRNE